MVILDQARRSHDNQLPGFNAGSLCSAFCKISLILFRKQIPVAVFHIGKDSIQIFLPLGAADIIHSTFYIMQLAFHHKTMISPVHTSSFPADTLLSEITTSIRFYRIL